MASVRRAALYLGLAAVALVMVGPFLWLLSTSLKGTEEIFSWPPRLWPGQLRLENYAEAWCAAPFGRYLLNSLVVALGAVALNLSLSALAAYPLARLPMRGRRLVFLAILATWIVPQEVIVIPLYTVVLKLGLADSLAGVVLPFAVNAFGIFMLRQAYLAVPRELEEAAVLDGASPLRVWWNVMLPLARPALAALGLFTFIAAWGDFLWPLIVLRSPENYTLQVGLNAMVESFATNYRWVAAGSIVATLPAVAVFLAAQRHFLRGLFLGSGK